MEKGNLTNCYYDKTRAMKQVFQVSMVRYEAQRYEGSLKTTLQSDILKQFQ